MNDRIILNQQKIFLDPPVLTRDLSNGNYTILHGGNLTLSCEASGTPQPSIEWYINNNIIKENRHWRIEKDGTQLVLSDVVWEVSGVYQCVAKNKVTNVSSSAIVNVFGKPSI